MTSAAPAPRPDGGAGARRADSGAAQRAAAGTRNAPAWVTAALVLLGLLLVAVGVVYLADTAAHLPSVFPGHQAGSSKHHTKHALASFLLALASFVGAWLSTGRRAAA